MNTRDDSSKPGKPVLRLVSLDEHDRLLQAIRRLEGDRILADLDMATTVELRVVLEWLQCGKPCRTDEAREWPLADIQPAFLKKRRRLDRVLALQSPGRDDPALERNLDAAHGRSLRERTLRHRFLLAKEHMGRLSTPPHSSEKVRAYVRWGRVASKTITELLKLRGRFLSRQAAGGN